MKVTWLGAAIIGAILLATALGLYLLIAGTTHLGFSASQEKEGVRGGGGGRGGRGGGGRGWSRGGWRGRPRGGRGWGNSSWGYGNFYSEAPWWFDPYYYVDYLPIYPVGDKVCDLSCLSEYKKCVDNGREKNKCAGILGDCLSRC